MNKKKRILSPIQQLRESQKPITSQKQNPSIGKPPKSKREYKPKSLKQVGERGKRRNKFYNSAKKEYESKVPCCELCKSLGLVVTSGLDIHHKAGRKGPLLWHQDYFARLCRKCHIKVHSEVAWSYSKGWLKIVPTEEYNELNRRYRNRGMF